MKRKKESVVAKRRRSGPIPERFGGNGSESDLDSYVKAIGMAEVGPSSKRWGGRMKQWFKGGST
jgi:hypothetical protein